MYLCNNYYSIQTLTNTVLFMKKIGYTLIILYILSAVTGCQEYIPFMGVVDNGSDGESEHAYFDFSTVREVALNIDMGKRGSRAPIEIYTENPTYISNDGEMYYEGEPEFSAFLDSEGRYEGTMTLPVGVDKVWVYSMRQDLPQMMPVSVSNGEVAVIDEDVYDNGTNADGTPYGYSKDAAKTDEETFRLIAKSQNEDHGTKEGDPEYLKIWDTARRDAVSGQNIYTIVNWAGQRFGRIIPTHYYLATNNENVVRYELNEGTVGATYDNQNLINDLSEVEGGDGVTFGRTDIDIIQRFLWHGSTTKPNNLANHQYIDEKMTTEAINTVIPKTYINEKGEHKDVEGAEVWVTLLGEGARYMNGIGYYYYKTGEGPQSKADLKNLYIAIPNASIPANGYNLDRVKPFRTNEITNKFTDEGDIDTKNDGHYAYHPKFVPFGANQEIQLLYHNEETGEVSKKFPPGLTIGYFITALEATSKTTCPVGETYKINANSTGAKFIYSDLNLNTSVANLNQQRFLALNYSDVVVYGVEDSNGTDTSLEDVLFTVRTNPEGIAANPDRFTINRTMEVAKVNHRTYAFEDIWPNGGDYDMNDVVIDHNHKMFIERGAGDVDNDKVTRIEDVFEIAQPYNAADYHDAFGFQIPKDRVDEGRYHVYWGKVRMGPLLEDNAEHKWEWYDEINDKWVPLGEKGKEATKRLITVNDKGEYSEEISLDNLQPNEYIEIDDETHITFILFPDVKNPYDKVVTVVREFETPRLVVGETKLEVNGKNVLNPFIVSQSDINIGMGRVEVHLPGHEPTGRADKRQFLEDGTPNPNAYYRNQNSIYPFAISISNSVITNDWGNHFTEPDGEGVVISKAYPDYARWAETRGEEHADWYLNYDDSAK